MKIKHLVLLFFVNCSQDLTAAECKTLMLDAHASTTGVFHNTPCQLTQAVSFYSSYNNQIHNDVNEVALRRVAVIYNEQIEFVDKKMPKSEYKKSVKLDDSYVNEINQNRNSIRVIKVNQDLIIDPSACTSGSILI